MELSSQLELNHTTLKQTQSRDPQMICENQRQKNCISFLEYFSLEKKKIDKPNKPTNQNQITLTRFNLQIRCCLPQLHYTGCGVLLRPKKWKPKLIFLKHLDENCHLRTISRTVQLYVQQGTQAVMLAGLSLHVHHPQRVTPSLPL